MREAHRLSALQMRVARQERRQCALRRDRRARHKAGRSASPISARRATRPQAQIGGHLVVARAPRVELAPQRPADLDETRLDVHVHVFERRVPLHGAARRPRARTCSRPAIICASSLVVRTPARSRALRVGDRAADVVFGERLVDVDARRKAQHGLCQRAAEPSTPCALRRHSNHLFSVSPSSSSRSCRAQNRR